MISLGIQVEIVLRANEIRWLIFVAVSLIA